MPFEGAPSPERLDRLIEIVQPNTWLALSSAAALVLVAVGWSVVGRLPVIVTGRGVLVRPRKLVLFQAAAAGRVIDLRVRRGDVVHAGDVLATIEQPEVAEQLNAERAKLARLSAQDRQKAILQLRHTSVETQEIEAEKQLLAVQRDKRTEKKNEAEALARLLKQRVDSRLRMQKEGLLPAVSDDVVQAQQAYLDNDARIADLEADLRELDSRWKTLESRERVLARQDLDDATTRRNDVEDAMSRIAVLETELARNSTVVSGGTGRVVETTVNPGQVVAAGQRLGSIDGDDASVEPMVVAYFPVGDGKKIGPGMRIQLTPDSISRERFGGMLGTVSATSSFPATRESAANLIGNSELAEALLQQVPQIEVLAALERDPSTFSGYRWSSSRGPELRISPGTTFAARVTVEGRAPITYVLPFLRSVSGIY